MCFNLEPGSRYRVVEVRSQRHACEECEGEVVAVEVEKVSTPGAVPKKGAMEGVTITYTEPKCQEISCPNYWRCHAVGKRCPIGEKMVAADLL